jgi:hypothetical protein
MFPIPGNADISSVGGQPMEGVQVSDSPKKFAASRYIPHSLCVSLAVIVIPIVVAPLLVGMVTTRRYAWLTVIIAVALSMSASRLGSWLWYRLPGTRHIAFGELLPWTFVRLLRAERRLVEATGKLGFDRQGRRFQPTTVSLEDQKKILRALNHAVESKDLYTLGHTRRVSRHSYSIAKKMRLPLREIEKVRVAADVHDVGKIHVPDEILRKPDRLTDHEYGVIKKHSEVGAEIVAGLGDEILTGIVRAHHERWDGRGYPDGLEGTDIPLGARIIAVADTYDAITTTRSYRAKSGHKKAVRILREESGRQFDPEVVDAFLAARPQRVVGSTFVLSSLSPHQLGRWLLSLFESAGAATVAQAAVLGGAAVIGAATFAPHLPNPTAAFGEGATVRAPITQSQGVTSLAGEAGSAAVADSDPSADAGIDKTMPGGSSGRGGGTGDGSEPGTPGSQLPGTDDDDPPGSGGGSSGAFQPDPDSGSNGPGNETGGGDSGGATPGPAPSPAPGGGPGLPDLPDLPLPDLPDLPDLPLPDLPDLPGLP